MKRILINATQNEEIRVALCTGNHLYDFDLENRTREQKKSNIYKGHVTRVEPSLEAVFVEYGSQRQGFLPIREISSEYLSGNPRDENIKKLIKEGDELIVQVEKEERGNKGAALSTYVSLAGRYLVLMPNNPRGGGISRQISGKLREDMKRMLGNLDLAKGMSVIIRTAGIGKTQEDLQHDLNHLLNIWQAIQEQNKKYPSPRLVHQEAGVVTRAVRDYLRDDIAEIWIDNENAYIEAAGFIDAVMPTQAEKLRKYTDYEPMFSRFNIEKQIETAYQREVRLPSGGSIVIDQTEALVSIDINSAKSTKGSDVAETAYHTNLEAADEIARQLRLRDMGGLIVIDFIDMNDNKHQKEVEKRLIDATKYDRARVQFGDISKFGLMEMSRQRLRPSLEESTGYICPRCHGNGMIRDLRSLSLSIMRQIEQIALKERQGEVQAEVPTDIAAFLLNEKRDSLVYLEQDSGTRITILPHAHLESPNFKLHFNRDGFAPSSYERITDTAQEHSDLGYEVDWQTAEKERPEQQPTRQPLKAIENNSNRSNNQQDVTKTSSQNANAVTHNNEHRNRNNGNRDTNATFANQAQPNAINAKDQQPVAAAQPQAVAWLSNLFAQAPQAQTAHSISSRDAAEAIEALVNTGATSLGSFGQVDSGALTTTSRSPTQQSNKHDSEQASANSDKHQQNNRDNDNESDGDDDKRRRKTRKSRSSKPRQRREQRDETVESQDSDNNGANSSEATAATEPNKRIENRRQNDDSYNNRQDSERDNLSNASSDKDRNKASDEQIRAKRKSHSQRSSRGTLERNETLTNASADSSNTDAKQNNQPVAHDNRQASARRNLNPNEVTLQINEAPAKLKSPEIVHLSLDDSKAVRVEPKATESQMTEPETIKAEKVADVSENSSTHHSQLSNDVVKDEATENSKGTTDAPAVIETATAVSDDTLLTAAIVIEEMSPTNAEHSSASNPDNPVDVIKSIISENKAVEQTAADDSTTSLTDKALFANRYVTADKFGQASNDPRVVRAKHKQQVDLPVAATEQAAIRGTVGEFIRITLVDAQKRIADEGIINCFIAAIAEHQQQAEPAATPAANIEAENNGSFDFSNYGYQPLTSEYIYRFNTMTQAVSQFAAAQGKTAVTPSAITQRASNDPRGQHPDFQHVEPTASSATNEQKTESSQDESAKVGSLQSEAAAEHQENVETVAVDTNTNADAVQDNDLEIDAHKVTATALTGAAQAENISADSEQLLQASTELKATFDELTDSNESNSVTMLADDDATVEQVSSDDSQAHKSKTTIASYKNMIENVAEQLLPQMSMFNLTTPKIPKARTRKPKTEHKKPMQAEKLEADDADSEG